MLTSSTGESEEFHIGHFDDEDGSEYKRTGGVACAYASKHDRCHCGLVYDAEI